MKPLFSSMCGLMTARRFIGALGVSLIALGAHAGMVPLDDEAGESGKSGLAEVEEGIGSLPAQSVTNIEVHPEGDRVTVAIVGDGRFFPDAKLLDESRLVIDMPAVASAFRHSTVQGQHQLLKTIRVGHHADRVRLVFDLLEQPAFSVEAKGNKILVVLSPKESQGSHSEISQSANPLDVSRPALQERKVLFDSGPRTVKKIARIIGPAQSPFRVQPVQMAAESAPDQKDSRSDDVVAGQTRFVGRRISLDFQQADITNILRLIADVSGFNIVVGEAVKSKVTMKLVNVPWDQALDMLLKMNGLGMIRQGSIVWVDTLSNLAKQQDEEARAKDAKVKAEELIDRVFYIKNIQAQELMTSLRQYLSPRGVMQFNAGSNALIVRETESKLAIMRQLVEGLDLEVPQVQIEARIVQADTVYARGLGIQWGFQAANRTPSTFNAIGGLNGPFGEVAGTGNSTISRSWLVNLPAQVGGLPAVPGIGWTFGKLGGDFALDMRLSAGELLGLTKVIAAPKIMTLDKREAKISQGESIPFQTTSLQGTQTTFVDANLELNVTPQITSRDPKEDAKRILLKVRATRNAVGARSNPAGPSIDRREANTQVLVRDGETMVIGGVFVDTQNNNVQGVPYMSRIPVLGWLFKNKSESVSKQELLIFLTPSIVKT
ncbi:MAG: type IV pilus secretin PilQ [Nitrospiraceae bacterium]|uniref:type IV pilus secretin PilQ n=1 Tax=Nitrospira cf. moscoviensis SBR1015 TaxID=96242 RepID=UPI000B3BBE9B|nr:type IV pilus secretin PilQ [Nitrospira cf. moscoviensis SBR1015]MBY0248477.1 type IV pilus secretin PilQ [Nitrospiraceae bacterium]